MKLARYDYYQGILQLRDVNQEILDFVQRKIKKRKDVAITKISKLPNGFDLYLTSQKFIRVLGKNLKDSFGGELKVSSKLHSRNKIGKPLYRVNVLFKLSKHKKGDIVVIRGDTVRLIQVGRRTFARDLKTGKKVMIRAKDLSN